MMQSPEIHHFTCKFQNFSDSIKSKTMLITVSIFEFKPK